MSPTSTASKESGLDSPEPDTADWEFRVEQEREQFQLYERRRVDYEVQAAAVTAGALALAAVLVAGQGRLAKLGDAVQVGTSVAIFALVVAVLLALTARFASWGAFAKLQRREERRDTAVRESLQRLRSSEAMSGVELRKLAYEFWNRRAESAWRLGAFKQSWLKWSGVALIVPMIFLVIVGIALLP
jgi:hypothetical protein